MFEIFDHTLSLANTLSWTVPNTNRGMKHEFATDTKRSDGLPQLLQRMLKANLPTLS
jgi:hypothetical protein